MFLDLPSRLAKAVLRLADTDTNAPGMGGERKATITQRELGDMIGMSRESTNKQLRIWQNKKWVRLDRGAVVILSAEALSLIAETDSGSE